MHIYVIAFKKSVKTTENRDVRKMELYKRGHAPGGKDGTG